MNTMNSESELDNKLIAAAERGNVRALLNSLNKGAHINARDADDCTALHYAANHKNPDLVKILLERGADVHAQDSERRTPLHYCETAQSAELLIQAGAELDAIDYEGNTPLHTAAAVRGRAEVLQHLLEAGAEVNDWDQYLQTPLMRVMESSGRDKRKKTEILLSYGADVNESDRYGRSALIHAAQNKCNAEIIGLLIESGADTERADTSGSTAWCYALVNHKPEIIRLLKRSGASEPSHEKVMNARLIHAINHGRTPEALAALQHGASPEACNYKGTPALHLAVYLDGDTFKGLEPIIVALLQAGANPNGGGVELLDNPPLGTAAEFNSFYVLRRLLEAGAWVDFRDQDVWTPLMRAAQFNAQECANILLAAGADPKFRNYAKQTALDIAIKHQAKDCQQLLQRGIPYDAPEPAPCTSPEAAMCYAIKYGDIPRMKAAEQAGCSINGPLHDEWYGEISPLLLATRRNQILSLRWLLAKGCHIEGDAYRLLQWALTNESESCLLALFEAGAWEQLTPEEAGKFNNSLYHSFSAACKRIARKYMHP